LIPNTNGQQVRQCTVGTEITITCTLPVRSVVSPLVTDSQVVRICEGSSQLAGTGGSDTTLGAGTACRSVIINGKYEELGHIVVSASQRTASVKIACPGPRGLDAPVGSRARELGGLYSLYRSLLVPVNGGAPSVTCTVN